MKALIFFIIAFKIARISLVCENILPISSFFYVRVKNKKSRKKFKENQADGALSLTLQSKQYISHLFFKSHIFCTKKCILAHHKKFYNPLHTNLEIGLNCDS